MLGEGHEGLDQLGRFKSGQDFFKSFTEAQNKIRSGEHKAPPKLGENPTDEELAAYRQEIGVPAEAKGYLEDLPDGLVLGEADEAAVDSFLQSAHGKNMDPKSVHTMLDWYSNTLVPQQMEAQAASDQENRGNAVEALRGEWGGDYQSNLQSALNHLNATFPKNEDGTDGANLLLGARLADGTLAGDNPQFLKWLASIAHEANPAGFVAPGTGLSQAQSVDTEIATIEKTMRDEPNKYWGDNAMQDRYRTLLDARTKLQGQNPA